MGCISVRKLSMTRTYRDESCVHQAWLRPTLHGVMTKLCMQDAVTTCCESMDELQTATEGGHSNPAVQEAVGSLAARLGQAEKALQKAAAQQVGNSSRIAAMAAQRAHLQGGLEDCACQLASLREEVRSPAIIQEIMPFILVRL